MWRCPIRGGNWFLSVPSAGRVTGGVAKPNDTSFSISIHALRKEGDRRSGDGQCRPANFYPRPPRGGRPAPSPPSANSCKSFLSTPSARRATDLKHKYNQKLIISIHALREEGDGAPHPAGARTQHFYPRPPRGGRPACASMSFITVSPFLSTPSARRATQQQQGQRQGLQISIHALREEGDASYHASFLRKSYFYPRPPRGGRQGYRGPETTDEYISIHALREEGDLYTGMHLVVLFIFLSTPSARRATRYQGTLTKNTKFLSTPSARRATKAAQALRQAHTISIHALREEGDVIRTKSMLPV